MAGRFFCMPHSRATCGGGTQEEEEGAVVRFEFDSVLGEVHVQVTG